MLFACLIACRVVMLLLVPHADPSEARYAEISRKMVETSDWITPQYDYGIPFWAKPPLSMWMSAAGIELFGSNEFGSRIFIFIASLGILLLVARSVRRELDETSGLVAATLLLGMPLFFYCSAAVMTDLPLVAGTTLAMVAFRTAVLENSKRWGYAFFIGLAIGLLAKGPLALVIAVPPIAGWIFLTGTWRRAWKSLPWISGTLLMLTLSVPWYLAAEHKTPGFLNYFLVGEHWKRFTVSGWKGDLYGKAHSKTPGTIWLFLLAATFPWFFGFFAIPFRRWRESRNFVMADHGRGLYWLFWALWPVAFFTPSRNIIATYPLPALPAIAMLLAMAAHHCGVNGFSWKRFHPLHPALVALCLCLVIFAGTVSIIIPNSAPHQTERELVEIFHNQCRTGDHLLYFEKRRYSAEFYSEGAAEHTESSTVLIAQLDAPGRLFAAMKTKSFNGLPPNIQRRFVPLSNWGTQRINLYLERTDTPTMTGIDAAKTFPIGS